MVFGGTRILYIPAYIIHMMCRPSFTSVVTDAWYKMAYVL